MIRFPGGFVAAVTVLLMGAFDAPAPGASQGEEGWRLLYAEGDLRDGTGALKSQIPAVISVDIPSARFSPDGSRLATPALECVDAQCDESRGSVRVHEPDGSSSVLAWVPDLAPKGFAWAPDGSQVAVLGMVITPDETDMRIYLFPLDGSPATLVYSDTMLLRIEVFRGLSWNPQDNRLAFVASEFFKEGASYYSTPGGTDQVWTVPAAASATPTRFSGTPVCGDCAHVPGYRQPTWSPDGSRLAVVSNDPMAPPGEQTPPFLGYLEQDALAADKLNGSVPEDQMAWSHDGAYLAYGVYDTSGDGYDETEIVDSGTGAVVAVVDGVIAPFVDWLPCPGGTCQVWQDVYTPPVPTINVSGRVKGGKVVVAGELFRVPEVADVRLTLQKRVKAGSSWRKVTTVQVQAVEGLFERTFQQPRAVRCRVRGVYDDGTSRAVDAAVFRC